MISTGNKTRPSDRRGAFQKAQIEIASYPHHSSRLAHLSTSNLSDKMAKHFIGKAQTTKFAMNYHTLDDRPERNPLTSIHNPSAPHTEEELAEFIEVVSQDTFQALVSDGRCSR